jgi:hypothetical protein
MLPLLPASIPDKMGCLELLVCQFVDSKISIRMPNTSFNALSIYGEDIATNFDNLEWHIVNRNVLISITLAGNQQYCLPNSILEEISKTMYDWLVAALHSSLYTCVMMKALKIFALRTQWHNYIEEFA